MQLQEEQVGDDECGPVLVGERFVRFLVINTSQQQIYLRHLICRFHSNTS